MFRVRSYREEARSNIRGGFAVLGALIAGISLHGLLQGTAEFLPATALTLAGTVTFWIGFHLWLNRR